MAAGTLAVLASGAERAGIGNIDGSTLRCSWRLVGKRTIAACASEVEATDAIGVVLILRSIHGSIHVDISTIGLRSLVGPRFLETSSTSRALNPVRERAALTILESRVDCWWDETRHELRHHPGLFFQHGHELHLVFRTDLHHPIHVAVHTHSAHIPTSTTTSATPLVSAKATDAAISLLSAHAVKSRVVGAVHISVHLVEHSSSATLLSVAHGFRSGGTRNGSQYLARAFIRDQTYIASPASPISASCPCCCAGPWPSVGPCAGAG